MTTDLWMLCPAQFADTLRKIVRSDAGEREIANRMVDLIQRRDAMIAERDKNAAKP